MLNGYFNSYITPGATYTLEELNNLKGLNLSFSAQLSIVFILVVFLSALTVINRKHVMRWNFINLLSLPIALNILVFTVQGKLNIQLSSMLTVLFYYSILLHQYIKYSIKDVALNIVIYLCISVGILYSAFAILGQTFALEVERILLIVFLFQVIGFLFLGPLYIKSIDSKKSDDFLLIYVTGFFISMNVLLFFYLPYSDKYFYNSKISNIEEIEEYMIENNYEKVMFTNSTHPEKYEEEKKLILSNDSYYPNKIVLKKNYFN